ncbi:MAG: 2-oxo-4-hydroxy-4-carboxy-5-ureidoimidazoline decarboxylase [Flavobacteriales bacterium]
MLHSRPFEQLSEVLETSDTMLEECDVDDYEEAFTTTRASVMSRASRRSTPTPRAGPVVNRREWKARTGPCWNACTQGMKRTRPGFGHIFIVCHRQEPWRMAMLEARMKNDPKDEMHISAAEQNKIARLRLKKLLA